MTPKGGHKAFTEGEGGQEQGVEFPSSLFYQSSDLIFYITVMQGWLEARFIHVETRLDQ